MVLRILYLACLVCVVPFSLVAQVDSVNHGPEPIGGIAKLAVQYFKIDFTKEQRKLLEEYELELIFMVDAQGNGELEKVNGIVDQTIIDSLMHRSKRVAKFEPQVMDGKAIPSIYFMTLQFPQYGPSQRLNQFDRNLYKKPTIDDFEYVTIGSRWDILIGGVYNQFLARPADYLGPGGGMKIDILFGGAKDFKAGMLMSFYGNGSKQDYPISTPRPQENAPPTMIIGLATNHRLWQEEKRELSLQIEVGYAIQNLVTKTDSDDDFVQLRGWSPGVVGNYTLQLGKGRVTSHYLEPVILTHHLNFHVALRYIALDLKEATGPMFELGLAYRMRYNFIKEYKLKDGF